MPPRIPPSLFWTIGCFFLALAPMTRGEEKPASPETPNLEKIVAALQQESDSVEKKAKELLAVVDAEASAKRISETAARGLRWSFRDLTSSTSMDIRGALASATLPADDEAIMKAERALEDASSAAKAESGKLLSQAEHAMENRCSELVGNATTTGEVDAFLSVLERLQNLVSMRQQQHYSLATKLNSATAVARSLRDSLELTPSSDPATVSRVLTGLSPTRIAQGFGKDADFSRRIAKVLAPFQKAFEDAQTHLDATLAGRKPAQEIDTALAAFETAATRYGSAASFQEPRHRDALATLNFYRSLCKIAGAMEQRRWSDARREVMVLRQSLSQFQAQGVGRDTLTAQTDKWDHDLSEAEAADKSEFLERLRAKLGAVKKPSDLEAIIMDIAKRQRDSEERYDPRSQGLSVQLSALAAAWENDDLNRLANGGGGPEDAASGEALAGLREQVERDILSRTLKAPELLQSPLESQPLAPAIDALLARLTAAGDWRRALQIMESQTNLEGNRGAAPHRLEAALAVRSYLAGQNFELAELWTDAAAAYKVVLATALDGTPVKEAADRLKALAREHPAEVKAARTLPPQNAPFLLRSIEQ